MGKISVETDKVFKVSLEGYDVDTATPEQCAIHSGFDYPKIEENLEGYQIVTAPSTIGTGFTNLLTIDHNLGYIPFFDVYLDDVDNNWQSSFAMLPFTPEVPVTWLYYADPTATQLKIGIYYDGTWGDLTTYPPCDIRTGFKWHIWVND